MSERLEADVVILFGIDGNRPQQIQKPDHPFLYSYFSGGISHTKEPRFMPYVAIIAQYNALFCSPG